MADLPIVVLEGTLAQVSVTIPWRNIWTGDCELELVGLVLKVASKKQYPDEGNLFVLFLFFVWEGGIPSVIALGAFLKF